MKLKPVLRFLALLMALPLCACSATPAGTSSAGNGADSKAPAGTSSVAAPTGDVMDIDAMVKTVGYTLNDDVSVCFKEDAAGYIINGGPYKVSSEVLERLTSGHVTVSGTGSVIWANHVTLGKDMNPDPFDGVIPVEKLNDPFFCSMNLPSEFTTYMTYRVNGTNMYPANAKYDKILSIGAIYKDNNITLPDDAKITVCLGKIYLLLCTEEKGWYVANEMPYPDKPNHLYYLPWSLEHTLGNITLPDDRLTNKGDHLEIALTGADLNGSRGKNRGAEGTVLHFWGTNSYQPGDSVKGVVVAFEAWIKEENMVGKVGAAIGADWRTPQNEINQAISGRNYLLSTEKRLCIAHNMGPNTYDNVMDVEKVKSLLGMN